MKKTAPPLTTYTKVILSGWPAIFEIIAKYTKVKKQLIRTDLPLVSTEQLEEVFLDKQTRFIQYSIATRARALIAFIALNQELNELEKQKNQTVQALITIEEYLKEDKTNPKLIEAVESARNCLADIKNTQIALEKKQGIFQNLNERMDNLLNKQDEQWEAFRDSWSSKMIEELEKIGIRLTALEKTEIKRQKTTAELIERMRELGLSLPKNLSNL